MADGNSQQAWFGASPLRAPGLPSSGYKRKFDNIQDEESPTPSGRPWDYSHWPIINERYHPAVPSGPSEDPKKQLMGMPREIRDDISANLLPTGEEICLDFKFLKSPVLPKEIFDKVRKQTPGYELGNLLGNRRQELARKITPVIFRLCKQIRDETRHILYGKNKWVATHALAFKGLFLEYSKNRSDASKATLIRDLTLWPGMDLEIPYPELKLTQVVRFICNQLPALEHLQLTQTEYISNGVGTGNRSAELPEAGLVGAAFLSSVSQITLKNPLLRKAIWNGKHGKAKYPFGNGVRNTAAFTVDFVCEGSDKTSFEPFRFVITGPVMYKCNSKPQIVFEHGVPWSPKEDIVLDCAKIGVAKEHHLSIQQLGDFVVRE